MSSAIDLADSLELHNASGAIVGYVVTDGFVKESLAERDRLRQQLPAYEKELIALRNDLDRSAKDRDEIASIKEECEWYRREFQARIAKEMVPDEEGWAAYVAEVEKNPADFSEFVRSLETELSEDTDAG